MTTQDTVGAMKELLADPKNRIKLEDFVFTHVKEFLTATSPAHFPVQALDVTKENFVDRVARYEAAAQELQRIVVLLARWGDESQLSLLRRVLILLAEADRESAGTIVWLRLSWYPILFLVYSAGITAVANRRYDVLRVLLETEIAPENKERASLIVPLVDNLSNIHDSFKWLPGVEQKYVPRSEYLFEKLKPDLDALLFLGSQYENAFDEFEVMQALVYSDVTERDWGPVGRFGWKHKHWHGESPYDRIVKEAGKHGHKWSPLQAGLFQGSTERFQKNEKSYRELLGKFNWF